MEFFSTVWHNDLYAQDWNFPKSRALRGFLFFDLFLFEDGRVVDGNRVEGPHQMYALTRSCHQMYPL